jgi:holin-like protein
MKTIPSLLSGSAILFGCLALGEGMVHLSGLPIPSSIFGMLILLALLKLGWIKPEWVKGPALGLISLLPFLFVAPGISIVPHFPLLKTWFWPVSISLVISSVLVLFTTGFVHQLLRKRSSSPKTPAHD